MKKLIALLIIFIIALILPACDGSDVPQETFTEMTSEQIENAVKNAYFENHPNETIGRYFELFEERSTADVFWIQRNLDDVSDVVLDLVLNDASFDFEKEELVVCVISFDDDISMLWFSYNKESKKITPKTFISLNHATGDVRHLTDKNDIDDFIDGLIKLIESVGADSNGTFDFSLDANTRTSSEVYYITAYYDKKVFVRSGPGTDNEILFEIEAGDTSIRLKYLGESRTVGEYIWYKVLLLDERIGWAREDVVVVDELIGEAPEETIIDVYKIEHEGLPSERIVVPSGQYATERNSDIQVYIIPGRFFGRSNPVIITNEFLLHGWFVNVGDKQYSIDSSGGSFVGNRFSGDLIFVFEGQHPALKLQLKDN